MTSTRVVALMAIALFFASLAWAQGGNPPASTKQSGATSGHGMTAAEQTGEGGDVGQQIRTLQDQARDAALKGDTAFLEKYLADDYEGIGGDGTPNTKDQAIQMRKSGVVKYEAIDVRNMKIRAYGDTAIVNALASVKLTVNGKAISGDYRATFVWVKQGGSWKQASFQATPVAAEAK
jgi:hypothetical protein